MLVKLIATAVVGASLLAPVALADPPADRWSARDVAAAAAAVRPDDRAGPRGPGAFAPAVVAEPAAGEFDWADATIGGAAGLGAALLVVGGGVLLLTQRSRPKTV
jgi:hypothetical protein